MIDMLMFLKECSACKRPLPPEAYSLHSQGRFGLQARCRDCCNKAHREMYHARQGRRDNIRRYNLWNNYGITVEQYDAMLEEQGGVCAICGKPETTLTSDGTGVKRLAVDHDRSCCPGRRSCGKCLRGLLCSSHNTGLGKFHDSIEELEAAIEYLRMH